jgi:hypothetical protein
MRAASSSSGLIDRSAASLLVYAMGRKRVAKARIRIHAVP